VKILHVIHSVNPRGGGPIEGIRQLAPALAAQGVAMEVMSLDAPDAPLDTRFSRSVAHHRPLPFGYGYTPAGRSLAETKSSRYDAVIVNGLWQYAGFAVWRALRGTATPYYVYPHGMLDPWFKRRYPLKHLKKWLYWPWAEYRVLRDATAVLFTSEEEKARGPQIVPALSVPRTGHRLRHRRAPGRPLPATRPVPGAASRIEGKAVDSFPGPHP
jgi:hypothetical protein